MNILFIAPYRSQTGWGEAARAYALALYHTKHELVLRPVYMDGTFTNDIHPILLMLEQKRLDRYDVIIQKVLPPLLEFSVPADKNINLCAFETSNLQGLPWIRYINMVDQLWVPSNHNETLQKSGIKIPIEVIYEPVDITKFERTYNADLWYQHGLQDNFTFYFIGEYIPRKNLQALVIAFHREFDVHEPVDLLIKTNKSGIHFQKLTDILDKDITQIKETLQLYKNTNRYKKEWIITEHLPIEQLHSLHQVCDCFVMPSRGEACCRPMLDALGFGNPVIITENTGMCSYVNNEVAEIVPSHQTPVYSTEHPLAYLYTGYETWEEIDIIALQKSMRKIYELKGLDKIKMKEKCKEHIQQFSYEKIAEKINTIL